MNQKSNREMLDLQVETNFCFFKVFHLKFIFKYFVVLMSSSRVIIRFKSPTYTSIIENMVFDFLIKIHGHMGLFTYPFSKYSLRQLYHMHLDCVNSYRDRCNLIEHI